MTNFLCIANQGIVCGAISAENKETALNISRLLNPYTERVVEDDAEGTNPYGKRLPHELLAPEDCLA